MEKNSKRKADTRYSSRSKTKLIKINDLQKLSKIRTNVAGIDVGSEHHFVAAPDPLNEGRLVVKRFGSFTAHLKECVDWLVQSKIESVAMEATGVYWMILHSMLIEQNIEVVLVNGYDFHRIKEKKTDVCDAEFLQLYHSYGLLKGAFIPEIKIKELRTYSREREKRINAIASTIQKMQKCLICMNLRLDNVLSDITGVSGMSIIKAILRGERDPDELVKYRDPRCKKSEDEIKDSLHGFYQEDQLFTLKMAVEEYEFILRQVQKFDEKIQNHLSEFSSSPVSEETLTTGKKYALKKPRSRKTHEFSFDLHKELIRITGVDLTLLPGVGPSTALTLISETGLDMSRWKSPKHFASWLRVAANNQVSGGKILRKNSRQGSSRAGVTLRMAVSSLYSTNNDTALGAFLRRKKSHIGAPKAITAAANKLAKMYYMTLFSGKPFVEPGESEYLALQKGKYLQSVQRRIRPWGLKIAPIKKVE